MKFIRMGSYQLCRIPGIDNGFLRPDGLQVDPSLTWDPILFHELLQTSPNGRIVADIAAGLELPVI